MARGFRVGLFVLLQAIGWSACFRSPTDQSAAFTLWLVAVVLQLLWSVAFFKIERELARIGVVAILVMTYVRLLSEAR